MPSASDNAWPCHKCFCSNPAPALRCWNCHLPRASAAPDATGTTTAGTTVPPASLSALLERYVGEAVQINFRDLQRTDAARLTHVHSDYFSVADLETGAQHHFPLRSLFSARESGAGSPDAARQLELQVHRTPSDPPTQPA
jgi:hypothetical protein